MNANLMLLAKWWNAYGLGGILVFMSDVTQILSQIESGDPGAADQLLPVVYDELRKLAAAKLAKEKPGQTLQATALVHEAYLRLVNVEETQPWNSQRHFFAAAAEAMRRILVDQARRKGRLKHGGNRRKVPLDENQIEISAPTGELLDIDEVLQDLAEADQQSAELVKLRYFAGFSTEEAAEILEISPRTAYRDWDFARAWLHRRIGTGQDPSSF